MERNPISRAGYDKLREQIRIMEEVDMPAVTERIKSAREEGDLKDWLDNSDSDFNERVFKALGEIDMKFGNMTVTYKDSVIVKE